MAHAPLTLISLSHLNAGHKLKVALKQFGPQGLVELTTLMGFYAMLAFNANAVDLGLPQNLTEPPLPV